MTISAILVTVGLVAPTIAVGALQVAICHKLRTGPRSKGVEMERTRPKTCVLTYVNGEYQGCGKCDACHDATTSAIENDVECGLMTEQQADKAHEENDARYGVIPFSVRHGLAPFQEG